MTKTLYDVLDDAMGGEGEVTLARGIRLTRSEYTEGDGGGETIVIWRGGRRIFYADDDGYTGLYEMCE